MQDRRPDEVLVVWQAEDYPTRDAAEALRGELPYTLRVLHCPTAGVVPAENTALRAATGDIVLLIDDDAIAPRHWIARYLAHYEDPSVGAVGGSAVNFGPDGSPYPVRSAETIGRITWFGRMIDNMHDLAPERCHLPARDVDHLVGYNMSLRRTAFNGFETGLKRYWQRFETDACLQVKSRGLRVLFDFANTVDHHPTNTVFSGGRHGDLTTKIYNPAYNHAFVLSKHSPWYLRPFRILYLLGVGTINQPGILAFPFSWRRYGSLSRELEVLRCSWSQYIAGWRAGARARRVRPVV